jgi:NAD(P)-dependent dehydrogenase (short-subunit alcohol dehydrogenase family)
MNKRLHGKRFIITGGASGIGLALCQMLLECGVTIEVWDVNVDALAQVSQSLGVPTAVVDVRDADAVAAAFQRASAQPIDGVIHSAALVYTGMFETMPPHEHATLVAVNLGGAAFVALYALPHLRKTHGSFVFLGSVSAFVPSPEFATYGATKAGIYSLAQSLDAELHGTGVHIGVANPLFVTTPMLNERLRSTRSFQAKSPLLRVYTPELIAAWIVRGIEQRQFMIWMGFRTYLMYFISRYAAWLIPWLTRYTWK